MTSSHRRCPEWKEKRGEHGRGSKKGRQVPALFAAEGYRVVVTAS